MRLSTSTLAIPVALASCLALLAGCASQGYDKSGAAAQSLKAAAADVQAQSHALDSTVTALTNLVHNPPADLTLQFRQYDGALDRLVKATQRADNTVKKMEQRNADYFQAWDERLAAIQYEHVRNVSASRKTEVTNSYERVHQRYLESQAAMNPMIQYLTDIRTALSTDLTPGGLAAVKATAANAEQNASKVQQALGALASQLHETGRSMSSLASAEQPGLTQAPSKTASASPK